MEQDAASAASPDGHASRGQRRQARESARRRIEEAERSGRHRRTRMTPLLWDLPGQSVYCSASGQTRQRLFELFERTFSLGLVLLSAGELALRMLEAGGRRRDYEDLRPTRFVHGPAGESEWPEYPWTAIGPQPKDFLGNEFLLWLWHEAQAADGTIPIAGGPQGSAAQSAAIVIEKRLVLDCAFGQTGKDVLSGGTPAQSSEALDGLRSGKLPRSAGLTVEAFGQQYSLTISAESLACTTVRLPEVPEAESPRVLLEERISLLRDLSRAIDGMFGSFLKLRTSSGWESHTTAIRRWIVSSGSRRVAAVA
jgi:hypothetical protein